MRIRRFTLAVLLLLGTLALSLGVHQPRATAAVPTTGGCPDGSYPANTYLTATADTAGYVDCFDNMTQEWAGRWSTSGQPLDMTSREAATAQQLDYPSSVLTDASASGATDVVASDAAVVSGSSEAGPLMAYAAANPAVATVGAFVGAYTFGADQIDPALCSKFSIFCVPSNCAQGAIGLLKDVIEGCTGSSTATLVPTPPNGDIGANPNGWSVLPPWSFALSSTYNVSAATLNLDPNVYTYGENVTPSNFSTATGMAWGYNITVPSGGYAGAPMRATIMCQQPAASGGSTVGFSWLVGTRANNSGSFSGNLPYQNAMPNNYTFCSGTTSGTLASQGRGGLSSIVLTNINTAATISTWYPVGNASRPAYNPDPPRNLVETTTCSDGSTQVATSAPFLEDQPGGWPVVPTAPNCAAGTVPTQYVLTEIGQGVATKTLQNLTVPTGVKNWAQTYPQCDGQSVCKLTLYYVANGANTSCFESQGQCQGWFQDANKSTDYQCEYGVPGSQAEVALTECNVYADSWDPVQEAKGQPYANPATGATPTSGTAATGTQAGSAGSPLPGEGGANCFASGWSSFNPLEWVYKPVQCVLSWAFVPNSTEVQADLSQVWASVESKPPFSIIVPMVSFIQGFVGTLTGSCSGNIANFGNGLVIPCNPPPGIASYVTSLQLVIEVLLFGLTAFALWSMLESGTRR